MNSDTPQGSAHLHIHSHYALLGGTAAVDELAARAAAEDLTYLALTDTNALHRAVAFAKACRAVGIQLILDTTAMGRMIGDCTLRSSTKARSNPLRALVQHPATMSEVTSCHTLLTVAEWGNREDSHCDLGRQDDLILEKSLSIAQRFRNALGRQLRVGD